MRDHDGIVEIRSTNLIEANDGERFMPACRVENKHRFVGIDGEGTLAGRFLSVRISGEETLGKTHDGNPFGIGSGETFLKPGEVVGKVSVP